MFGDSFWPRQVGRTATKLSYVTQNSLHCPLHFIASRHHFECYFFKEPALRTTRNPLGRSQRSGEWAAALLSPRPDTHLVSRKNIALLLNKLKFEKTDTVFIKGLHSGLWQNFLSLLAQMVVEQKADKLFS